MQYMLIKWEKIDVRVLQNVIGILTFL